MDAKRTSAVNMTYHVLLDSARRGIVSEALAAHGGNRTKAARALGMERTNLLRLIRELGIDVPPGEHGRPDERPRKALEAIREEARGWVKSSSIKELRTTLHNILVMVSQGLGEEESDGGRGDAV